jgi:murein DD-endopeptidase MepM/ murein hydrolase activator NlpD
MTGAVVIESPIHGLFITPNTPGSRVPSHGTTRFGEAYAIDFVVLDPSGRSKKPYRSSILAYLLKGLPLRDFHGWGQPVFSPIAGTVVRAIDGIPERDPVNIFRDFRHAADLARRAEVGRVGFEELTGNSVVIQYAEGGYCLLAHLQRGSVHVREGQQVDSGDLLGGLGHSGNSTMPHLHLQLMDSLDMDRAQGLPFLFREYSVRRQGTWTAMSYSLPMDKELTKA